MTCRRSISEPRGGGQTARCYAGRNGTLPATKWPGDPHQSPWATPSDVAHWESWRRERTALDSRTPREYVIQGESIRHEGDFMHAMDEALFGPNSIKADETMGGGFDDWLYWAWPRREGQPRPQSIIGDDPRWLEDEPFAVLIWKDHLASPRVVLERATDLLANNRITCRLE